MNGLLDFLQSASNMVAGNVAGPVDLLGMGLNKIGLNVGAAPVGGSEWMKRQGLMRDVEPGAARVLGETAGLLGPAMVSHFAPQIAKGLLQAGDNLAAPRTLNPQAGKVLVGPQSEALETAQRNAAKSIEDGGLGLPPNNTPMDRARALGFDTAPGKRTYHGSRSEISGPIDPSRSDFGFHTGSVDQAEARLRAFASPNEHFPEGANVLPLMKKKYINMLKVADEGSFHADSLAPQLAKKGLIDKSYSKKVVKDVADNWRQQDVYDPVMRRVVNDAGYDGLVYSNAQEGAGKSYAFSNPSVLRSPFAAFDPARIKEADLLGRADPRLLGLLGIGVGGGAYLASDK